MDSVHAELNKKSCTMQKTLVMAEGRASLQLLTFKDLEVDAAKCQ